MPQYAYQARTQAGRREHGFVEAPNAEEAVAVLQNRELLVLSIQEKRATTGPTWAGKGFRRRLHRGASPADMVFFARSLAAMLEAGLPLLRALETIETQVRSQRLSAVLLEIARDIRGGSTFRDSLARHPVLFSPFCVSLVETGEASGQLAKVLEQIAIYLEKIGAIRGKVVSALIYPAVLVSVAVAAILIFTLKIIPTFASLYASFGAELPLLNRLIILFSNFLRKWFLLAAGAVALSVFLLSVYIRTKQGRWQWDGLKLRLPVFGPVSQGATAERFAANLGTLLRAGVPILHALDISIATCDNTVMASVIEQMRSGAREGRPLAEPLTQTDLFPPMVAQMLSVGEQTGKLPDMLEEISKYYKEQVATAVARMTSLVEPATLILMGLVIGVLVIAMYMPIFRLTQVFRG